MKDRLNVTKSEAKQIGLFGNAVLGNNAEMYIDARGGFYFNYFNGNDQTTLTHENEYKDYEWRLTDINYLNQGDICKLDLTKFVVVFDSYVYLLPESKYPMGRFWSIKENRPEKVSDFKCYKLFKKSEKK